MKHAKATAKIVSVHVPQSPCPACNAPLDCASDLSGATPKKGDLTICLYCGVLLEFDENLKVQRHTLPEWSLPRETRASIALFRRVHGDYREKFGPGWRKDH